LKKGAIEIKAGDGSSRIAAERNETPDVLSALFLFHCRKKYQKPLQSNLRRKSQSMEA